MPSRTAAHEPGREMTILPRAAPATARDNIAAGPISSKLSARKSSPKPSRRFSITSMSTS